MRKAVEGGAWALLLAVTCSSIAGCRVAEKEMQDRTPRGCANCHTAIAQQWESSAHATAWLNPAFVERTNNHLNQLCLPCHAPRPLLEQTPGERPHVREEHVSDGIDCNACHQLGCGYAGPYRSGLGPHPTLPEKTRLPCAPFCGTCHERELAEYHERYAASASPVLECVQCHMPTSRSRLTQGHVLSYIHPQRVTHDHAFSTWTEAVTRGAVSIGHPTAQLRSARELAVAFTLTNQGAGHNVPTGKYGHREVRILVEAFSADGRLLADGERSLLAGTDAALAPGVETPWIVELELEPGDRAAQVRLRVERVDRERTFRYPLAELQWPLGAAEVRR